MCRTLCDDDDMSVRNIGDSEQYAAQGRSRQARIAGGDAGVLGP